MSTCVRPAQATFWEFLRKPGSERFFAEIHKCFLAAETEIKNNPMGLVVQQDGGTQTLLVQSMESGMGTSKSKSATLVSQLSFDQRDLNVRALLVCVCIHVHKYAYTCTYIRVHVYYHFIVIHVQSYACTFK